MRNLILFIAILFSGFVSAQTFDFSCEPSIDYTDAFTPQVEFALGRTDVFYGRFRFDIPQEVQDNAMDISYTVRYYYNNVQLSFSSSFDVVGGVHVSLQYIANTDPYDGTFVRRYVANDYYLHALDITAHNLGIDGPLSISSFRMEVVDDNGNVVWTFNGSTDLDSIETPDCLPNVSPHAFEINNNAIAFETVYDRGNIRLNYTHRRYPNNNVVELEGRFYYFNSVSQATVHGVTYDRYRLSSTQRGGTGLIEVYTCEGTFDIRYVYNERNLGVDVYRTDLNWDWIAETLYTANHICEVTDTPSDDAIFGLLNNNNAPFGSIITSPGTKRHTIGGQTWNVSWYLFTNDPWVGRTEQQIYWDINNDGDYDDTITHRIKYYYSLADNPCGFSHYRGTAGTTGHYLVD